MRWLSTALKCRTFKRNYWCFYYLVLMFFGNTSVAQIKQLDSVKKKTIEKTIKNGSFAIDTLAKSISINKLIQDKSDGFKTELKNKMTQLAKKEQAYKDSLKNAKKIQINNFEVQNSTLINGNRSDFSKAPVLNNISVLGQIQVFKIPFALDLTNNSNDIKRLDPLRDALFKMNLDRSQVRETYQNDLDKFNRFKKSELSGMDIPSYLKKGILEKFDSSSPVNLTQFPKLVAVLNNKTQLSQLISLDDFHIREKINQLMSEEKIKASAKADSLSEDKKREFQQEVTKKKAEVAKVIVSVKDKIEDNGLDRNRLLLLQKFIINRGSLQDFDALLENEINQQPNPTAVSRFYSKIKEFQVGNFGKKMPGGFMNQDLMINGASFSIKTSRGPVSLGFGVNKEIGMPKDEGFNNSIYGAPKLLTFVSVPATNFDFGSGKLSWVGSFDKQTMNGISQVSALPKNEIGFFLGQDFNTGKAGRFTFELSKSGSQYKNIAIGESDKLLLNKDLKAGNFFTGDVSETMSAGIKHNIELKKLGLSSNTFFSYSGLGYQNPGQQGYSAMGMRFGGTVKKNLFKNRIVLNARTDIKNTPISTATGAHWRNYNVQLDSRFKISRNYTLNLKYGENGVNKVDVGSASVYSSQKMQADVNANYKIGGNYGVSHLSIGKQAMFNPSLLNNTNFMTLIYSQNLVMKTISLSANAFYNKELTGARLLGDMLNADMGCQYTFLKKLNISSSITYLDNENIARQVGVRQNIQLNVLKNFDVSAFVDIRKDLITSLYPDLFSTGRGELSIRYHLK